MSTVLSPREAEIAILAAAGLTYQQIGEGLGITRSTVRVHVQNAYRKLNIHNRLELYVRIMGYEER